MTNLIEILSNLSEQEKEELKQLLLNDGMNGNTDNVIFCPKCKSFHVIKMEKYPAIRDLFAKNVVVISPNTKTRFLTKQRKICLCGNLISKKCSKENL